eukprot:6202065-Pleurochrysis_carterae.AAC.1
MPSGRRKGPEKSRSTVHEACAGLATSEPSSGPSERSVEGGTVLEAMGIPGGWSHPVSLGADVTVALVAVAVCFQGYVFSSKYTSEVSTTRGTLGTRLDARLRVSGAWFDGEGPATKGKDGHDAGFGAGERLVQKDVGAPLATRLERVGSMMLRIARSATPLSWWTCGGHVVACTPSRASRSANWWDRNSPALSLWIVPTTRVGVSRPALRGRQNQRGTSGCVSAPRACGALDVRP